MPNRLSDKANRVVGTKQVLKYLGEDRVQTLFLAMDIDRTMTKVFESAIDGSGVEVVFVPSMSELGRACDIDVGAACAAVLKRA